MMLDLTTLSLMTKEIPEVEGKVNLPVTGTVNGVALWIDWQLDEATVISGGPTAPVTLGQNVQWDMHSKQAVYFIKDPLLLWILTKQDGTAAETRYRPALDQL